MLKKILLIASGASGQIYTHKFIKSLPNKIEVSLIVTKTANKISKGECNRNYFKRYQNRNVYNNKSFYSKPASGSAFDYSAVVVLPASMGFLARCATGISSNLAERAFDVAQKEGVKTIVCFREFPLSKIHLKTLTTLADLGVIICPLSPSFYNKPKEIKDIINQTVGRIQQIVGIENKLYKKWEPHGQQ